MLNVPPADYIMGMHFMCTQQTLVPAADHPWTVLAATQKARQHDRVSRAGLPHGDPHNAFPGTNHIAGTCSSVGVCAPRANQGWPACAA